VRVIIEQDEGTSINYYDCYGHYEWCDSRRDQPQRPAGMDGSARKLWLPQNMGCVWWQPMKDRYGWHDRDGNYRTSSFDAWPDECGRRDYIDTICNLIAFEHRLIDTAYNSAVWHIVHTEWVGGCDSFYRELLDDLADQLPDPIQEAAVCASTT
jgi:hypothetical protein